ncbi:MAG TPA: NrfD/PsrC family molybdoenzyme membrane anchor subunit, partial [Burkholderiaceae bacterium]|nr:NrfD/PsrC family molybdoenzyme membrane anchor subunit [Burkholderiaceae bacterium]
ALGVLYGAADFQPLARRATWLALALAIGGLVALFMELGHPLRALYAIPLNFQVKAPLFWKVLGVAVYLICLLVLASSWLAKPATTAPRGVATVAAVAALFVIFTGALTFATLSMRPFWHSGEVPVMILVEAMLGGMAFTLLAAHRSGGDEARAAGNAARWVAVLTFAALLFVSGRAIVGLASNLDGLQVWNKVVGSVWFWIEVALLVIALWLTASAANRASSGMQTLAMLAVIVALFIGKYEFVIAGQLVPLFKGSWVHGLIQYTPAPAEWALLLAAAFLAYAVYAFGAARFRFGA